MRWTPCRSLLALLAASALALLVPAAQPAAADTGPASGPFVTLLMGRTMWAQSDSGRQVPGQPTLAEVAPLFAERGVRATGVVVPDRIAESAVGYVNGNLYPSWGQLAGLRDDFGWSFVSNGQARVDITTLSPEQQLAESCGSLPAFDAHGHHRAWGLYGPGSNRITDAIASDVVDRCFAFTRLYSNTNLNDRASVMSLPHYVKVDDTSGGTCNSPTCSGSSGLTVRYMLPAKLIGQLHQATPEQWVTLSTYKLLTSSKTSGNRRWDCTSPDPVDHWTTEVESYCLSDLLTVLDALPSGARVADPAGVAEAWGRVPVAPDVRAPAVTTAVPAAGAVLTGPSVVVSGTATDDVGVVGVDVSVQDADSGAYLGAGGTWSPTISWWPAAISGAATAAGWSWAGTLAPGRYVARAVGRDPAGNVTADPMATAFTVLAPVDVVPPVASLAGPADGAEVTGPLVVVTGSAADDVGVAAVELTVQDAVTGQYVDAEGAPSAAEVRLPATTSGAGSAVGWSWSGTLPPGSYVVRVLASDGAGNVSEPVSRSFHVVAPATVTTTPPDVGPPTVTTTGVVVSGPSVVVSGTATDDVGVELVEVRVQDAASGLSLGAGGGWSLDAAWLPGTTSGSGVAVGWSWAAELATGSYVVLARAGDAAGHLAEEANGTPVEVLPPPDRTRPTASVGGIVVSGSSVVASGSASDDTAVASVAVSVQDAATGLYVDAAGAPSSTVVWLPASVTAAGSAVGWSWAGQGRPGSYVLRVAASDAAGNLNVDTRPTSFTVVPPPDVTPPTVSALSPAAAELVTARVGRVTGVASDDRGVSSVQVTIKSTATKLYVQPDGTSGTAATRLTARLASPGAASTSFALAFDLADGSYQYGVVTTDTSGLHDPSLHHTTFTVGTPDVTPPTATLVAPVPSTTVTGPQVALSGTATDDRGVASVQITLKSTTSKAYVGLDGVALGTAPVRLNVNVAQPRSTATSWSASAALPPGTYQIGIYAKDTAGLADPSPHFATFTVR